MTLVTGVVTPVYPAYVTSAVRLVNATSDDVQVGDVTDQSEYFILGAGADVTIALSQLKFNNYEIAFYLTATVGGTFIVIWL